MTTMTNTNRKTPTYRSTTSLVRRAAAIALGAASLAVPSGAALAACHPAAQPSAQPQAYTQVQAAPMPQAAPRATQRDLELYQSLSAPQPQRGNPQGDAAAAEVMQRYYNAMDRMTDAWTRPACTGSTNGCR